MKPIDDFELVYSPEDSAYRKRHPDAKPVEIVDVAPPYPRMRWLNLGWQGEGYWFHSLLYRGTPLDHVRVVGNEITAQFEAEHGYVLFSAFPGGILNLHIYYVLRDFSGAEWVEQWARAHPWHQRIKPSHDSWRAGDVPGAGLMLKVRVEDDRRLVYWMRRKGWFRLTLFGDRPRRDWLTCLAAMPTNAQPWSLRYFSVRRLLREPT